ncbi:TRAP transporter substrate-binding protein [Thalassospira sp. MCCC 1A01428]|uniref:TRAP transporter substrate-binding protein n=1 Tax=unclassified Thalassospira TaxID=2648997 RepID=UPI000A1DE027|nr:TRAP transporter substrate-binding protein [Thalassospira sp. MCCC 1A01428]OSQ36815.1 C4-dicarboxylate ABC transporter substrate-binding protein [Thalassospira sp. MCCC 1A01428]
MKNRSTALTAVFATAAVLMVAPMAQAQDALKLKIQTAATASHFSLRYLNENWTPKLAEMTEGRITIELLPNGAVVPHRDTPDAVSMGILDGDYTSVMYFAGRDPAFALMGDLTAGYDSADQTQAFCSIGGGREMLQKIYDEENLDVHVVGCGAYSRESFVSKVPIRGVADLKGKKIRAPEGLASAVFKAAGATPVAIPGSEVYTSLEKGIIDAADNSAYSNDKANGMHDIAKYPIFPGIHSTPFQQFTISNSVWDGLSKADQEILTVWYEAATNDLRRAVDQHDRELVAIDRAGDDIEVIDWSQKDRDAFREIAMGEWKKFAAGSKLAGEAYDTHVKFLKSIGLLAND